MFKVILIFLIVLLSSCVTQSQEKTNHQDKDAYQNFLDDAMKDFGSDAEKLNKEFKIGDYEKWDVSQNTGKLILSDKGIPKVIASVQIVGSYSTYSHTWKWSWANDTVDVSMKRNMDKIKEFGQKNQYQELTTAQWKCEEDYAWMMTAVAGQLLKAKGAYRGQNDGGFVYFIITDIDWAKK